MHSGSAKIPDSIARAIDSKPTVDYPINKYSYILIVLLLDAGQHW